MAACTAAEVEGELNDTGGQKGRIELERDLYLSLLRLGKEDDVAVFLGRALATIVELTTAARGYIELGTEDRHGERRTWFASEGCEADRLEAIQRRASRGIVAEAIASGRTVQSQSALLDERFSARESIQVAGIEAVLCTPIGTSPPLGVVYLEGHRGSASFTTGDRELLELFGEHLAPLADRVLLREMRSDRRPIPSAIRDLIADQEFVGSSPAFIDALQSAAGVAALDVGVLLMGDTGTGKTMLARIIHRASGRGREPFVELNCAALPEALLENELFGAVAGAHSGATRDVVGKIAAAGSGTLFLDEISELPLAAQAKLLQFLQSKTYFPLGASQPRRSDARLIAASNVDLKRAVAERKFREDLLWRLDVVTIQLPSLARRQGDLDDLIDHFCRAVTVRHGLSPVSISPAARRAIRTAEWPGNLRQLEHAIESAAIRAVATGSTTLGVQHLFPGRSDPANDGPESFQEATRSFQADLLRRTLTACDWNVSECARRLDLARSHVYTLIQTFDLSREEG